MNLDVGWSRRSQTVIIAFYYIRTAGRVGIDLDPGGRARLAEVVGGGAPKVGAVVQLGVGDDEGAFRQDLYSIV